jgi:hypothetical protein
MGSIGIPACGGAIIALVVPMLWNSQGLAEAKPARAPYDVALSISVDVGTVSMDRFETGMQNFAAELRSINPEISLNGSPNSGYLLALTPRFRLSLPHRTFLESGMGYLRNSGGLDVLIGDLPAKFSYTNTSIEIPLLFGGHFGSYGSTTFFGALGPSILFRNRSDWSYDLGDVSSFSSGRGGGLEFQLGADVLVTKRVALQVLLRYRVSRSTEMELRGDRLPPVQDLGELDYSGISLGLGGAWHTL